jgi:hypothetical protein
MKKVLLGIIKTGNGYRAVMQIGENPYLPNEKIVYLSGREITNNLADAREIRRELKEKAKKWAREQGIQYVINIDFDPYE